MPHIMYLSGGTLDDLDDTDTEFFPIHCRLSPTADPDDHYYLIGAAGTIMNMRITLEVAPGAGASGKAYDFTIHRNGGDTGITEQIFEIATTGTDLVNTQNVSVGDLICVKVAPTLTPNVGDAHVSLEFHLTPEGA